MLTLIKPTLFAALAVATIAAQGPVAKVGEAAPTTVAKGADGKTYNLENFKGKYVVLEWTNKDCPFVKKHYGSGNMQATQAKAKQMGAVWLSVCSSAPGKQGYISAEEQLANMKAVKSSAVTVLMDSEGKLGKLYGAKTTPQIVIINPEGKLIYNGAIDDKASPDPEDVKTAKNYALTTLQEAMSGKPISTPTTRPYGCSVKY